MPATETARLLDELVRFVRRYVVLTDPQLVAVALWVGHTHAFQAAEATPYLSVTSAEKESGKTRLLEVLELIVARPWLTGRVTPAVLARKVDAETPTLLLDESDAAFNGDKEYAETLRGILNAGYRRGGKASVCVGQGANIGYRDLATFAPKAIAGLDELPDTVASRSIRIRLKRRAPNEHVERFRSREAEEAAEPVFVALESWAQHRLEELREARPEIPDSLSDRAADVWDPLLAIGDLAGGPWRVAARKAAVELCAGGDKEDESTGVQLLADVHRVLGELDRIATADLLAGLAADDEAPWQGLTARALASRLRPYGIRSRTIRLANEETPKGYLREQFEDAWTRYLSLPHSPAATPPQPATTRIRRTFEPVSHPPHTPSCGGF
jgi:hypothetical protein